MDGFIVLPRTALTEQTIPFKKEHHEGIADCFNVPGEIMRAPLIGVPPLIRGGKAKAASSGTARSSGPHGMAISFPPRSMIGQK